VDVEVVFVGHVKAFGKEERAVGVSRQYVLLAGR
jgi:hypothetical protein